VSKKKHKIFKKRIFESKKRKIFEKEIFFLENEKKPFKFQRKPPQKVFRWQNF
jgi:hypothetical protein